MEQRARSRSPIDLITTEIARRPAPLPRARAGNRKLPAAKSPFWHDARRGGGASPTGPGPRSTTLVSYRRFAPTRTRQGQSPRSYSMNHADRVCRAWCDAHQPRSSLRNTPPSRRGRWPGVSCWHRASTNAFGVRLAGCRPRASLKIVGRDGGPMLVAGSFSGTRQCAPRERARVSGESKYTLSCGVQRYVIHLAKTVSFGLPSRKPSTEIFFLPHC